MPLNITPQELAQLRQIMAEHDQANQPTPTPMPPMPTPTEAEDLDAIAQRMYGADQSVYFDTQESRRLASVQGTTPEELDEIAYRMYRN